MLENQKVNKEFKDSGGRTNGYSFLHIASDMGHLDIVQIYGVPRVKRGGHPYI